MQIWSGYPRLLSRIGLGLLGDTLPLEGCSGCVSLLKAWLTMLVRLVSMRMIQNKCRPRVDCLQRAAKLSPVHIRGLVDMTLPEA